MNPSPETRWSLVAQAKGESPASRAALSELCEIYYAPVFAFISRWSNSNDARDLTHDFFSRLLAKNSIARADPERGKFRNFLFKSAKNFLLEMRAKEGRQKRGGNSGHLAVDELSISDEKAPSPDAEFDRAWACTVLDRALKSLQSEMEEKDKAETFRALRPFLAGSAGYGDQVTVAEDLGISETAVRVIVHRMRKRMRELVEAEVAQTLEPGDDVAAELRYLLGVF